MQLFFEIISKVIRKKKIDFMKQFLINLYKEAFPQLEGYISSYKIMSASRRSLYEGIPCQYTHDSNTHRSDTQHSNKSTGRFRYKNEYQDSAVNNEVVIDQDRAEYEHKEMLQVSSQETLSFRSKDKQNFSKNTDNQYATNFSWTSGKDVESKQMFGMCLGTRKILKQIDENRQGNWQNRYSSQYYVSTDSFCDPAFVIEPKEPSERLSNITAKVVWRTK